LNASSDDVGFWVTALPDGPRSAYVRIENSEGSTRECVSKLCIEKLPSGTTVSIYAEINPDSTPATFSGWRQGPCTGTSVNPCVFELKDNTTAEAHFSPLYEEIGNAVSVFLFDGIPGIGSPSALFGKGSGYITISDEQGLHLNSPGFNSSSFNKGSLLMAEVEPDARSLFGGWLYGPCRGSASLICHFRPNNNTYLAPIFHLKNDNNGNGCVACDFSSTEERMLDAYIAYYGRVADVDGLAYWDNELKGVAGNFNAIANRFISGSEYTNRFSRLSNDQLINGLFNQLYGRNAEPQGLRWYVGLLDEGKQDFLSIAMDIFYGTVGDDMSVLENRIKLARHYITGMASEAQNTTTEEILANYLKEVDATNVDNICNRMTQNLFPSQ